MAGFEDLRRAGKIRHWGVSNFDTDDMEELYATPDGRNCQTNQILYNLSRRGPEFTLCPWHERHKMPIMAYSPFEQERMKVAGVLSDLACAHNASGYQIALAWLLHQKNMIAIPKSANLAHVRDNRAAADITLTKADLVALDEAFKPPRRKPPLDSI